MDVIQILILALVQALTEFLPISSSGHLVLASYFLGWQYQGIAFDLALHFGTLLAVLGYFRRDLAALAREALRWRPGVPMNALQRLGFGLGLSTIPAVIVGATMGDAGALVLRHPLLIAVNLIVFGLLLGWADRRGAGAATTATPAASSGAQADFAAQADTVFAGMTLRQAWWIGCAQALALVPGTSRSGITLTAGLMLGLSRGAAARYSFLMSVPVMLLALVHSGWEMRHETTPIAWGDFALGAAVSCVAGLGVIHLFLGVIRRAGVQPFVIYRVLLGVFVGFWYFAHR
jgi:undecaprenyl-diphosphatase